MNIKPYEYKIVALINKKLPTGQALNAIAHLGLGLCAAVGEEGRQTLAFLDFVDKDSGVHRSISGHSLVVLQGSSNDIRRLRKSALDIGLPCVDFTATMTGGIISHNLSVLMLLRRLSWSILE